ncbi:MAG: hypothetical protein ICV83_05730 [Cytophagales bacterium]|nr:hypothetical protein [Cytophagales bacterium]
MRNESRSPENSLPPALPPQLANLLSRHPEYDFVPLLELVTCQSPDGYEAFFNHVAELVCRHLHDGEWDNRYLVRILHELFRFRDAFRGMRGGAGWE